LPPKVIRSAAWKLTHLPRFALILVLLAAGLGGSRASDRTTTHASANTFLLASDIHFNPMYDASLVKELAASDVSQWEAVFQLSKLTSFSQYGEDTNWWLLQSALDQMRSTLPKPAFIMINGDILAHDYPTIFLNATHDSDREHYRSFVLKTVEFLALELRKRFKDTKIFLTPGNNDEECGNYSIRAGGTFLHDSSEVVQSLSGEGQEFKQEWEALGSYNVAHPTLHAVRIISLNTVFFSNKYHAARFADGCARVDSNGPDLAFAWLESNLEKAQQAHEKVWLMFHIPPGIDAFNTTYEYQSSLKKGSASGTNVCSSAIVPMWVPKWTAQFDSLLEKYRNTIIASFAGHTHNDDFRVIGGDGKKNSDRTFILINPPVSPIYNQNPAFRTVSFNQNGSLRDESTYYLTNLTLASTTTSGKWSKEYSFSEIWKGKPLDAFGLAAVYKTVGTSEQAHAEWLKLYNVSSSAVHLSQDGIKGLYCAIESLDPGSYNSCYCPSSIQHNNTTPGP
jgi:sphingomyelin phosphodiesterase acid-like 3